MTQEEKDIIYEDACCRLPYRPYAAYTLDGGTTVRVQLTGVDELAEYYGYISDTWGRIPNFDIKLYLRPMSSMTEAEAKEISILYGIKDILSTKITDEYIEVVVDDNFSSTEKRTIWYNEIVSSIEIFDWLNAYHFDYRGLIEKELALEAPEYMYNNKND